MARLVSLARNMILGRDREGERRRVAAKSRNDTPKNGSSGAKLGFEEKLLAAAYKMRSYMNPAEYKHVVLGLIFLKCRWRRSCERR